MSRVMLAADTSAIFESRRVREEQRLLRRVHGLLAGIAFLALRVPVYAGALLLAAIASLAGIVLYALRTAGVRLLRPAGTLLALFAALACFLPQRAHADTVTPQTLLAQANYLTGPQTNMTSFSVAGAGTLSVYLSDLDWPVPLQSFTGSILGNDGVLGSWTESQGNSSGEFTVSVSGAGTFDAFVAAVAGQVNSELSMGIYGLRVTFTPGVTPVPLPAALDLFLGGLGLLGAVALLERISRDRNKDVMSLP